MMGSTMLGSTPWGTAAIAVLPTGGYIDPCNFSQHEYWDPDWVLYVLFKLSESRTRPTRVMTSHGSLGLKLNDEVHLEHDQDQRYLGHYRVVGITYASSSAGRSIGDVPAAKIKHCVIK